MDIMCVFTWSPIRRHHLRPYHDKWRTERFDANRITLCWCPINEKLTIILLYHSNTMLLCFLPEAAWCIIDQNMIKPEYFSTASLQQEMDPHGEKACGDGYHANGQSDSGLWSDAGMEPVEPRRPRLSFSDMYVQIQFVTSIVYVSELMLM